MSMSVINGLYNNYTAQNVNANKRKKETKSAQKTGAAQNEAKQPKLSKAAQNLLEKLRKTYGDMDFMVADFENSEEARNILSRGTKEVSVLFSADELEKMAADENVEQEYMGRVKTALRMSDQINKQFGFESAADGKGKFEDGVIAKIGVSFNSDGTMSYFAELEKMSEKQRERIEETRDKRAEEKRAAAKEGDSVRRGPVKRTTVEASSIEELLEKMREVDWSKIQEETKSEGVNFDLSI